MAVLTPTGRRRSEGNRSSKTGQAGVSCLWVLITVALLALASALAGTIYAVEAKREREAELLRIGREFRAALPSYYKASPGNKQFPKTLQDLIRDPRYPGGKRHLRRIYADPIVGGAEWGEVRVGDRILGVHSLSDLTPLKIGDFEPDEAAFEGKQKYSEWTFVAIPETSPMAATPPRAALPPVVERPGR